MATTSEKGALAVLTAGCGAILVQLTLVCGLIYAAIHFIRKFW
ncbi:MAG TPA: hypothetical protein VFA81_12135 [Burkholderiales bacterium]|nr:hypothetical protein [Burkholderiales bacterium]